MSKKTIEVPKIGTSIQTIINRFERSSQPSAQANTSTSERKHKPLTRTNATICNRAGKE